MQRWRDKYLRWVADRRDLLVPSLVADKRVEVDDGPAPEDDHAEDETSVIAGALR